jgi:hypothetical protein
VDNDGRIPGAAWRRAAALDSGAEWVVSSRTTTS